MTPDQIVAVEDTMRVVDPDDLAADFYRRAFDADPELAELFTNDPVRQRRLFAIELRTIVGSIRELDAFRSAAAELGARHHDYGVRASHYDTVGEALLWTLRERLGGTFTLELREAWAEAYYTLASVMIGAASGEAAA